MQIGHLPHVPAIIHFELDRVFTGSSIITMLDHSNAFAKKSPMNGFLQICKYQGSPLTFGNFTVLSIKQTWKGRLSLPQLPMHINKNKVNN
jgi:hypothetical protein